MTKTVTLTLEQAETALRCVEASIVISQDALDHDEAIANANKDD